MPEWLDGKVKLKNMSANSKILIAIPSYKRSNILKKYTYSWIRHTKADYKIFIRPDQTKAYAGINNLIVLEDNIDGIGYANEQIKKYALENGYDFVFKIDDDIKRFMLFRELRDMEQPELQSIFRFNELLDDLPEILEKYDCLNFMYRNQLFQQEPDIKPNSGRIQTCFVIKTDIWKPDRKISANDDYAIQLELWKNKNSYAKFAKYSMDLGVGVFEGTGGHQSYDRKKLIEAENELLKTMYPFVEFKTRVNKKLGFTKEVDLAKTRRNIQNVN